MYKITISNSDYSIIKEINLPSLAISKMTLVNCVLMFSKNERSQCYSSYRKRIEDHTDVYFKKDIIYFRGDFIITLRENV